MIAVRDLTKDYRDGDRVVRALDGVHFQVDAGEFVVIVGKSGSGKSTLMNLLGCLDVPTAGSYLLDGEQVSDLPHDALSAVRNRKIGFVFQGFHLVPRMTALENVELPLRFARIPLSERHARAEKALVRVGLGDRIQHRPAELSGGQQQRVAIARALVLEPPLLLADEPTGNLDPDSGAEVISILQEVNHVGTTVLLITHDREIDARAGRVLQIAGGRLVADIKQKQ
mgnify:CR=1 FL=1